MIMLEKPHIFVTQLFLVVLSINYCTFTYIITFHTLIILLPSSTSFFIRVNECIGMGNLHNCTKHFNWVTYYYFLSYR